MRPWTREPISRHSPVSNLQLCRYTRLDFNRQTQTPALAGFQNTGYWFKEISVPAPQPQPTASPAAEAEPERTPAVIEADAKLYAALYPDRVTRIRAAGGLPPDLDFGPPEPEIVEALLRGAGEAQSVPPHAT
jgi:hypothetical protein